LGFDDDFFMDDPKPSKKRGTSNSAAEKKEEEERKAKKQRKMERKEERRREQQTSGVDVADERFAALYEDAAYALDTTDPNMARVSAPNLVWKERERRRSLTKSKKKVGGKGKSHAL